MGWFSPIKGGYPSLGQIDKTLPVDSTAANNLIFRGMIVEMTGTNTFKLAASVTTANEGLLYVALQDTADSQAVMAGEPGVETDGVRLDVPKITGLSLAMEGEYETSMFQSSGDSAITASTAVGTGLTVKNGLLAAAGSGDTVVAYLTGAPESRWINNMPAAGTFNKTIRQGANALVVRYRTK